MQRQLTTLLSKDKSLKIKKHACKGTGFSGYISVYKNLKRFLKKNSFEILHAHYSLIGTITLLARKKEKVVVSFMGSDVYFNGFIFKFARWFVLKKADHIIVKSDTLLKKLPQQKNISVIPNGINMELFRPVDKAKAKEEVGWNQDKVHILFPAGKNRYEKNYPLAEQAITELGKKYPVALHLLEHIAPDEVPIFLNAADIVLLNPKLTSLSELVNMAHRTKRKIKQNIAWALGYNLSVLPFAVSGVLTPWQAALGMSLSSIIVVYNSTRLMR